MLIAALLQTIHRCCVTRIMWLTSFLTDPCNKKRRFHPFRGLRRIFRKKARHQHPGPELQDHSGVQQHVMLEGDGSPAQALDAHRSRSTSTLLSGEETAPRRR